MIHTHGSNVNSSTGTGPINSGGVLVPFSTKPLSVLNQIEFSLVESFLYPVCKTTGRLRRPINRPGDLKVYLGGPLGDQDFCHKMISVFHDAFILFPAQQCVIHKRNTP